MNDERSHLVFAALADPTRRLLFQLLCEEGSGTATRLAARFPMTRQAITKHLTTLAEAGLVTAQETGRERRYTPHPESLQAITSWIAAVEARWDTRLAALRSYLLDEQAQDPHSKNESTIASIKEGYNSMTTTIEKERFINATPQRVFQALTEKAELERWFVRTIEIELRPGGAARFEWSPEIIEVGKVLAYEPSRRFSYTWEAFSPSPTTITFLLAPENDGTRLHLSQTGIGQDESWGNYANGMSHGWDIHLTHLISWLETGTCPPPGPTGSL
jgi:uncharacterized protein YndB with AHSA1/START domain/DNA-binding transcriptional ArsR family regulator